MKYKEKYLQSSNNTRVRMRINENLDCINVIYIHGLGERLEHFDFLYEAFESSGISLHMLELRGHGLSDGEAKYIKTFDHYVEDLKRLIDDKFKGREFFLMGHSTGALVESLFCQKYENKYPVKGVIFISPLFKLKLPSMLNSVVSLLNRFAPKFVFKAKESIFYKMTHDRKRAKILLDESIRTVMGTKVGFANAFIKASDRFKKNISKIVNLKTLVYLARKDILLDTNYIRHFLTKNFKETGNLELHMLDDCYHSILLETKNDEYMNDIINWIKKNS